MIFPIGAGGPCLGPIGAFESDLAIDLAMALATGPAQADDRPATDCGAIAASLSVAMAGAGARGVAIGACGGAATGGDTTTEGCGVGAMGAVCKRFGDDGGVGAGRGAAA